MEWTKKEWKKYWKEQKEATKKQVEQIEEVMRQRKEAAMNADQTRPYIPWTDHTNDWVPDANHRTNLD